MTYIEWKNGYRTIKELKRAYERLHHRVNTNDNSARLLVDQNLNLWWCCRTLSPVTAHGDWHIIAKAGELDWPPLRPEEEIWPALLDRHPVPDDEQSQRVARMFGKTVEQLHREQLRSHYLSPSHIGDMKRNPTDVNFDPIVRDWQLTAREFAEFLDTHRPPKLTAEQRVMEAGYRRSQLMAALASTEQGLARLMRNAAREATDPDTGKLRRGLKSDLARWTNLSRPTIDEWLADTDWGEPTVPDDDRTGETEHKE